MDPVGVSFGVVSLLFQVFSGCIKAYQLVSEAKGLEEKHRFLRVRFKTEQYRLLDWGAVAKIDEDNGVFLTNKGNRAVVMEVLDQQYQLMMSCQRLDERVRAGSMHLFREMTDTQIATGTEEGGNGMEGLDNLAHRFPNTDGLLSKALDLVDRTRKLPARLRWVVSDRDKMEDLLSRLATLNDFLRDMLSTHQLEMLRAQEMRTSYQIVQMNSRMDHLIEVIQAGILPLPTATALRSAPIGPIASPSPNQAYTDGFGKCLQDLVRLAQFKAVSHAVQGHALDNDLRDQIGLQKPQDNGPRGLSLDPRLLDMDVEDMTNSSDQRRAMGWYCNSKTTNMYRRIWIEWKEMEYQHPHSSSDGPNPVTLKRFEALVALLREDEVTSQFRAPKCLGYFLQRATRAALRYGLVFEAPSEVPPSYCPVSLRSLLRGDFRTPSLSARVALIKILAECLEKLHAVNWLHKGIRSENIIFFSRDGNDTLDLGRPYLSGFDYSRPESSVSMSENPPTNLSDDLYRHPNVQGGPVERGRSSGYRKFHDIYSMGLVFVEISLWKPLEAVVGVSDMARLKVSDILSVRDTLMSNSYQQSIESRMGDTVVEAIQACLKGMSAFGLTENAQGNNELDGEQLQARFYEIVVKPLTALRI